MEEKAEDPEEVIYQICRVCGEKKPLSEFHRDKTKKLCQKSICKNCKSLESKKYYGGHKGEIIEQQKDYRENHKKERAKYREDHKEEIAKCNKRYYQTERGCLLNRYNVQRRRARKAEAGGDGITPEEFERIVKNQGGKCNICRKKFCKSRPATMDHIVPLSKNGAHASSNIQALCKFCNCSKKAKIFKSFINSWCI